MSQRIGMWGVEILTNTNTVCIFIKVPNIPHVLRPCVLCYQFEIGVLNEIGLVVNPLG